MTRFTAQFNPQVFKKISRCLEADKHTDYQTFSAVELRIQTFNVGTGASSDNNTHNGHQWRADM